MWRWIVGILALIIVALMVTCYAGYRRLTGGSDTVGTWIRADSVRVLTLLTDRDSVLEWLPAGTTVMSSARGQLRVGDSVRVAAPSRGDGGSARAQELWIVREVKGNVFVVESIEFDPGGLPHRAYTRRDSLVTSGDSTKIVSTFVGAPLLVGADSAAANSGAVTGSIVSAAEKMRLGSSRMLWEGSLSRLRKRASN